LTLTLQQAAGLIGRKVLWTISAQVKILVLITNARQEYGRTRLHVQPVSGEGTQWVDETSLTIGKEKP